MIVVQLEAPVAATNDENGEEEEEAQLSYVLTGRGWGGVFMIKQTSNPILHDLTL